YQQGQLEIAKHHVQRAITIEERRPDVVMSASIASIVLGRIHAYAGEVAEARDVLQRIHRAVHAAVSEGRTSGALSPSQTVLVEMVDLATRDSSVDEWEALLERSARDSIEQEA